MSYSKVILRSLFAYQNEACSGEVYFVGTFFTTFCLCLFCRKFLRAVFLSDRKFILSKVYFIESLFYFHFCRLSATIRWYLVKNRLSKYYLIVASDCALFDPSRKLIRRSKNTNELCYRFSGVKTCCLEKLN